MDLTISPGSVLFLLILDFSVLFFCFVLFFPWVLTADWLPANEGLYWLNFSRICLFLCNSDFKESFWENANIYLHFMCTKWLCYMVCSLYSCWVCHMEFSRYINWVYYTTGFSVHCLVFLYGSVLLIEHVIWHIT